ncbi:MAG TPA: hypothetical protein DCK98_01580 [Chloroflexi bacterium]|nr:hypothetical protein [Chloroflexota bacterium]HAL25842.1 hypothetical protein [Chloroflexota bacterium]
MRYELRARVESELVTEAACFRIGDLMYEALVDGQGRLNELAVGVTVDAKRFSSRVRVPAPGEIGAIELGGDPAVHGRLVAALQNFESHVSFLTEHALRRVYWQDARHDTVPESDADEALVAIRGWSESASFDPRAARVRPDVLAGMAAKANALESLTVLKAFSREANNEHNGFRFIQTFVAHYFVIEGIYAPGRSGEASVLGAFAASDELGKIIDEALATLAGNSLRPEVTAQLQSQFKQMHCTWDRSGAMKFLFDIRGSLHHFNPRSQRIQGTPLNQDDFEAAALFAGFIAHMAIGFQEVALGARLGLSRTGVS